MSNIREGGGLPSMNAQFAAYLLRRLGMAFLTIFLVILITFFTMHAIPASPFSSEKAKSDATIAALEAKYGFDKPLGVQFFNYLKGAVHFDFGLSTAWVGNTVYDLIRGGFHYSATIGLSAACIALLLGVLLGSLAAIQRGGLLDKIIQVVTTALVSMPSFVLATLLLLIFCWRLQWFPTLGSQKGGLVLPIVSLALYPMAYTTRLQRSSMLDVLGQDYIRTAHAKGLHRFKVIFKHALKCSLSPIITYAGPMLAYILVGSMVVENIFTVPGLGRLFVNSMLRTDYMMIMGVTIFLSFLVVFMNFVCDILYKVVDPRINLS
jgi:oligopeptide transport system permease protein